MSDSRSRRKIVEGVVVSDRMHKTITVRVERLVKHPKYKKYVRRDTKYHAHDPNEDAKVGDRVEVMECRPLSRIKRWRLVKVLERARIASGDIL